MVEACSGEADCELKLSEKNCVDGRWALMDAEFTETWCNKITGYSQILSGRNIVIENATTKATYEAEQAAKAQMDGAISQAKAAMECGRTVKALLMVRNAPKGLSKGQIKQMVNTYAEIDSLLESGSLATAKDEIAAITPDGTLVTEGDKTALMAEIDKCL
jgi:hypothetical protein